jgi:tRNA1Val (adenine37-N6)-methyltransferase
LVVTSCIALAINLPISLSLFAEMVAICSIFEKSFPMISLMPFKDLIEAAHLLLSENGIFSVIVPNKEEEKFINLCAEFELYPIKVTRVKGTPTNEIKRSLLAFKRYELSVLTADELIIETARHQYTEEYIDLTKDFYLKM